MANSTRQPRLPSEVLTVIISSTSFDVVLESSLIDYEVINPVVLIGQLIVGSDFPWFVKKTAKY